MIDGSDVLRHRGPFRKLGIESVCPGPRGGGGRWPVETGPDVHATK
ncbi:hypothetical protein NSERUTF1_1473 [Nocardia seriolae]|nr:hypothetical protein NSERUTF1_1473 [Nocardia seriolae]